MTFNGVTALVSSSTNSQIVATVPAGATTGPISVTAPAGSATSSGSFTVSGSLSSMAPTITGFTPSGGGPGTTVTITGTNFQPNPDDNDVEFNPAFAAVTSASATSLAATVPVLAGPGPITVTTPYGEAVSGADFFVPPPGVSASSEGFEAQTSIGAAASSVSLNTANQQAMVTFNGTAGQPITVSLANSTFPGCTALTANLFGPNWSAVGSTNLCGSSGLIAVVLPQTGTYAVQLVPAGGNTGSLSLSVSVTPAISIDGTGVNISSSTAGQPQSLAFSGTAGTLISVGITNSTYPGCAALFASLYAPDGTYLNPSSDNGGVCGSSGPQAGPILVQLPKTGFYTMIFTVAGANTGSATVNVYNATPVTATTSIGGSPLNIVTSVPGQLADVTSSPARPAP